MADTQPSLSDEERRENERRRESFERWLIDIDDTLEEFLEGLPADLRAELDFSVGSLRAIETYVLDRYPSVADIRDPEEAELHDAMAIYVGETIRLRTGGGTWTLPLSDPRDAYYRTPILRGVPGTRSDIAPLTLITAAIDRRRGTYLHDLACRWVGNAETRSA